MPISSGATGSRQNVAHLPGSAATKTSTNPIRSSTSDQSSIYSGHNNYRLSSNRIAPNEHAQQVRPSERQDAANRKPLSQKQAAPSSSSRPKQRSTSSNSIALGSDHTFDPSARSSKNSNNNAQTQYGVYKKIPTIATMTKSTSATRTTAGTNASSKLGGQMVLIGPVGKPVASSVSTGALDSMMSSINKSPNQRPIDVGLDSFAPVPKLSTSGNFLAENNQQVRHQFQAASSSATILQQKDANLSQSTSSNSHSASSSTTRLHSLSNLLGPNAPQKAAPLNIKRNVNLKYVKTLIIVLMAIDLMVTLFVHHFSTNDNLSLWFTSHKIRFSLLNLILSSIWFIVLIGAIIFDVYFVLVIGCIVDIVSFVLLFAFSTIHFSRRIDYNTVNLTSLLILLFSIVILHVYLIVMATLTIYLAMAVKQRQKSRRRT